MGVESPDEIYAKEPLKCCSIRVAGRDGIEHLASWRGFLTKRLDVCVGDLFHAVIQIFHSLIRHSCSLGVSTIAMKCTQLQFIITYIFNKEDSTGKIMEHSGRFLVSEFF